MLGKKAISLLVNYILTNIKIFVKYFEISLALSQKTMLLYIQERCSIEDTRRENNDTTRRKDFRKIQRDGNI